MNACLNPRPGQLRRQTPLANALAIAQDFPMRRFLFSSPNQVLFDGAQTERFVLQSAEQALQRVSRYVVDWDGAGSPAPSSAAVAAASARLTDFYRVCISQNAPWFAPHVSASEAGDITFEWWKKDRKITLYIGEDALELVRVWGPNVFDEMDVTMLESPAHFSSAWTWLHAA